MCWKTKSGQPVDSALAMGSFDGIWTGTDNYILAHIKQYGDIALSSKQKDSMRSIYGQAHCRAFCKYWLFFNPPPQAFTIFDSDGNGEIDIGKLSLKKQENICLCMGLSTPIQICN